MTVAFPFARPSFQANAKDDLVLVLKVGDLAPGDCTSTTLTSALYLSTLLSLRPLTHETTTCGAATARLWIMVAQGPCVDTLETWESSCDPVLLLYEPI